MEPYTGKPRRIKVVPHFMRLHEWIAVEHGYFRDEGLEPDLLADTMHSAAEHAGDPYLHRPQDRIFVEETEVANSACAWGSVCNAGAGLGKWVPDLYGVGRYAIVAAPGSPIRRLHELRDVPVGVGLMAGSHFTTLTALEQVVPKEHITVTHTGGPGRRLTALLDGEVEVATLLDPEIPIAEAKGLRTIAQGEFRTLFWVSADLGQDVLSAYFRALRRADTALRSSPGAYAHLWERNVPPALRGDYDYTLFGTGEMLEFERFDDDMIAEVLRFADRWNLRTHVTLDRIEDTLITARS
jgi:ABC-type nitrate/sulfonate/bicarbonate transport system substrate-binding protein